VDSPALAAGDHALLGTLDQRGSVRSVLYPRVTPDIGAFEVGDATQFLVLAPTQVNRGEPFGITVVALDQWGNVASTYTGTVHFSSTDFLARLPDDSGFDGGAGGREDFTVTLETAGSQAIAANDVATPSIAGTVGVDVVDFGDLSGSGDLSRGSAAWWFDGTTWHSRLRR
jgi:hypothetical protein